MSLTSYRAAPPRANTNGRLCVAAGFSARERHVNGFGNIHAAPASKPGDDLLFHYLSNSTIGAVWFHGRVRDGIGWVTDAMVTKLWSGRSGMF